MQPDPAEQAARLQTVQDLLADEAFDDAAAVLESVAHPMTEIWLEHLRAGGLERLMLQESVQRHAADDPQLAPLQAAVEQQDYAAANALLQRLDHPMTAIWQRHLEAGGRQRLELQESLALHATDPRVAEVAQLLEDDRTAEARTLLVSMQHPMTQIWLDHLRAGGRQRLELDATPTPNDPPTPATARGEPEMDERMRRIQAMLAGEDPAPPVSAPAQHPAPRADTPAQGLAEQPAEHERTLIEEMAAQTHRIAMLDWVLAFALRAYGERPVASIGATLALFFLLMLALSGTAVGALVGILLAVALFVVVLARVETDYHPETDRLVRRFHLTTAELARTDANLATRVTIAENPPPLQLPASLIALHFTPDPVMQGNETHLHAQIIARTTFFALWAAGRIELRTVTVQHFVFEDDVSASTRLVVVPVLGLQRPEGSLENQMLDVLGRWGRNNRQLHLLEPWQAGPSIETLFERVIAKPGALVQAVQQEGLKAGYLAKGMFRGAGFTPAVQATVAAEAHNLNVLMSRIAQQHPTLHHRIIMAAARATQSYPVIGLRPRNEDF